MPNFDFLNPDNSGKSRQPEPAGLREPRYPVWLWSMDMLPREYLLACLTDDALFVRYEYKSVMERAADIAELCEREPETVLNKSVKRIPLDTIRRLRFDEHYSWLFLERSDGSTETISDYETRQTESIFATLHQRLAPDAPITNEPIRNQRDVAILAAILTTIVVVAAMFMWPALLSEESRRELGSSNFGVMLVDAIGAPATIALCLAPILTVLGFGVYKYLNPRRALTVAVRR